MTGGDIIKWGLIGLAGWWVYETFFAAATTTATSTTTTPSTTAPPPSPPAVTNTTGFNSLASLYNAMLAAATGANDPAVTTGSNKTTGVTAVSATGFVWNYYLTKVAPSLAPAVTASVNGNTTYTSSAYWALVEPGITTQTGLSGFRGGLGALAALVMGGRR